MDSNTLLYLSRADLEEINLGKPEIISALQSMFASGKKPARENDSERIICINLGLALDDLATAVLIYKKMPSSLALVRNCHFNFPASYY